MRVCLEAGNLMLVKDLMLRMVERVPIVLSGEDADPRLLVVDRDAEALLVRLPVDSRTAPQSGSGSGSSGRRPFPFHGSRIDPVA